MTKTMNSQNKFWHMRFNGSKVVFVAPEKYSFVTRSGFYTHTRQGNKAQGINYILHMSIKES